MRLFRRKRKISKKFIEVYMPGRKNILKIICKWVFKQRVKGIQTPQLKTKQRNIEDMSGDDLINMITTLLAQSETERLIIEKEGINK